MTQISRPFQIVLVAFALFVAVWFLALRAHNAGTSGGAGSSASGSSAPASRPASAAAAAKAKSGASSPVHTRSSTVTVKHSVTNASGHAIAVHTTTVKHSPASASAGHATAVHSNSTSATVVVVVKHGSAAKPAPPTKPAATATPSRQVAVEHELQQHKTVLILFWNPRGADDVAVHRELPAVQHALGGKVAVHYASASQVGAYGTITHAVQVTQTPTLLIVNPHGQTTTITGLADAFSIEQFVAESRA
jgi:hypothetical protein